jgi:phosphoribosylglycinamide formyltransferase-1
MKEIVLFASGSGSNVENIAKSFENHDSLHISCVLTNKSDAPVLERCKRLDLPALYFNRSAFSKSDVIVELLRALNPDLIVLAGFLWKIPENMVTAFPKKIINIHPALLPKYGGKGMYGPHVHRAVKKNEEKETGITVHYVNEHYDEGAIIFQAKTALSKTDTPETIAQKVHALEYEHYPKVIEELILENG